MLSFYGRYKDIRNATWQVLIDFDITSIPVSVTAIARAADISIVKNSEVNELKSNEVGVSISNRGEWYIVYDDSMARGRIRFTVAHELGHIFLGHPLTVGYHARTVNVNKPEVEQEADIFASRLLMPACIIWGLNIHTAKDIQNVFDVSYTAAEIRAERMRILYERNKFLTSSLEKRVYERFEPYIQANRRR